MDQVNQLFTKALGLVLSWAVDDVRFTVEEKRLDLHGNVPKGSHLPCPVCGQDCQVLDTQENFWSQLDFFQRVADLRVRVPPFQCQEQGVHLAPLPWAREGSGFRLFFEAQVMATVREMPVLTVVHSVRETDHQRLWRVHDHFVSKARAAVDLSEVHAIDVVKTSRRRSHDYIALFVDLEAKRLLFNTPGKDVRNLTTFAEDPQTHGRRAKAIAEVSMDLSLVYEKGAAANLPNAQITLDRFHIRILIYDAVDTERKVVECLLPAEPGKNPLAVAQEPGKVLGQATRQVPGAPKKIEPQVSSGLSVLPDFPGNLQIKNHHQDETLLKTWMENIKTSGLPPLIKVAYTMMNHWDVHRDGTRARLPMASGGSTSTATPNPSKPKHVITAPT
ncbi:ISL3 family transposase [Acidithiobacillus caldus]|nr:ISL3 family transposase [Acidithiobacillus caldus]MBU2731135.1 ISL3 family transposase [Acidithiobacillus caldus]MBU2735982.1 ISL3 family transposase [Acidithiobacillus caldus ATCC 51756]MBU2744228.1 ISL3 family transposase [Acidithiobacillus caldus]MBU2779295.1 ISL3 family transposase [Acidithiobacillus caldus]